MKKKKTHSNEIMKPHFKFIYTRKLFLNCKLLTMSSLQIIKTLTETIFHSKQSLALGVYIKSFRQSQIMIQFAICRVIRVKTVLLVSNYNNCKNNAIGGKVTIPIYIDNNRNSRSVQSTENDE
jgi:hypothetical protein